jgi:hypothetical protein
MSTPSDPNQPGYGEQSGLPNFPAAPPPSEAEFGGGPAYAAPNEVTGAFWCYIAAAVIIVVGGLLAIGAKQDILNTLRANNTSNLSEADLNTAAGVAVTVAVVAAIIVAALFALFAFKLRAGRNWARIVLAIIAALELINLLRSGGDASILSFIGILAAVVGAVLSFMPKASAYVAAVKASRARR